MLAVQARLFTFLRAPHFVPHRIVNNADDDLAFQTKRDRNAEVWDLVEIIHRAVERIDDPLMLARLIANDSFFAIKRVLGKLSQQLLGNQLLRLNVDREFDVVREGSIDVLRTVKIFPKQFTSDTRGVLSGIEIMLHAEVEEFSG